MIVCTGKPRSEIRCDRVRLRGIVLLVPWLPQAVTAVRCFAGGSRDRSKPMTRYLFSLVAASYMLSCCARDPDSPIAR